MTIGSRGAGYFSSDFQKCDSRLFDHYPQYHFSDGSDPNGFPEDADIVECGAEEFASFFDERDGMLFHSNRYRGCPYPLPVDILEQKVRGLSYHHIRTPPPACKDFQLSTLNRG